jgi:predicted thioredoxin/glutaredoxin
MKFYLFYSIKCVHSMKLLELIRNENLMDECNLIQYETNQDKIPEYIKTVPTIVAPNLSKPLVGIETVEWIKNKKYFNQITNNINNNNVVQPNIKSALEGLEFNKKESSCISDHYTNINDTQIDKVMLDYNKIVQNTPINNNIISDSKIPDNKLRELILLRKNQIRN